MLNQVLFFVSFVIVACLAAPEIIQPKNTVLPRITKMGGFHIGGNTKDLEGLPLQNVTLQIGQPPRSYDPNGEFSTGQMYVHYTLLDSPSSPHPLIMVHGGYQTGACWEDTPDGRPGWQTYPAGFSVYVGDAVERGRAGWSQYTDIFPTAPIFASKEYAWDNFRIGYPGTYTDTNRVPYINSKFPIQYFDQFHKINVPRWTTTDNLVTDAYVQLVDKICTNKCILLGHSQGGTFVYNITIQRPEKIAAVITIEPGSAPPTNLFDPATVTGVKHLTVWGDNVLNSTTGWQSDWSICLNYVSVLRAAGVPFDFVQLVPEYNIVGNSHFMFSDTNSDELAGIVYTWMLNNSFVTQRENEENVASVTASASLLFIFLVLVALLQ